MHRRPALLLALPAAAIVILSGCSSSGSTSPRSSAAPSGSASSTAPSTTSGSPSGSGSSTSSGSTTSAAPSTSSGSSASSAGGDALLSKAQSALKSAKSVRVSGAATQGAQSVIIDLGYATKGTSGSVTVKGFKFSIITLASTVYFKAPDAFWKSQAGANATQVLKVVSGKWIKAPAANQNFAQFASFANKDKFTGTLFQRTSTKQLKVGPDKTVAGVNCTSVGTSDGTLYVAKDGGQPIQLVSVKSASARGALTFSQYGTVPEPTAPPAVQTVDFSKLGGH